MENGGTPSALEIIPAIASISQKVDQSRWKSQISPIPSHLEAASPAGGDLAAFATKNSEFLRISGIQVVLRISQMRMLVAMLNGQAQLWLEFQQVSIILW